MGKVYVVTSGEYSDYTIQGIFSTKEKAEAFENKLAVARRGDVDIEVWTLDEREPEVLRAVYHAHVKFDTGDVVAEYTTGKMIGPNDRSVPEPDATQIIPNMSVAVGSSAVSAEHARKLAVETRQAWLRNRAAVAAELAKARG